MDNRESRGKRADEEYRGIFYEPPYSIWQAAVGFIVIAIGRLLYLWLWGGNSATQEASDGATDVPRRDGRRPRLNLSQPLLRTRPRPLPRSRHRPG